MDAPIDLALAARLRAARQSRGWTLDAVSRASGVSRALISKVERGEVSPTAATLGRLAAGLGVSLASLFADPAGSGSPLARAAAHPVWTDPATGYVRRNVSPAAAGADIVDVTFPPGERVVFDNPWSGNPALRQMVLVLEGRLEMRTGGDTHTLEVGDCLSMSLDRPTGFHNPTDRPIRYLVFIYRT